ncbi:polyprenyl synthetase family protein [Gemella sp. zg-570]|uniref:polyprenyl synthetase family protein n=1 Tax=Gemella sp. zg-570 TaxID=2840371 RepID=UPI001C0CB1E9|nr:polyprenyl synthetase family protein [Gemella sp. zg-570]QWQ39084.1 polyprenyl synthetase family protein [Gemella sp. zg-570]
MLNNYELEIKKTKKLIVNLVSCDDEKINEIIQSYFSSGGKGIRLILALVCSALGDNKKYSEDIRHIAAILEIIHTTTLIHDDIIDGASERRGRATLNNIYGNNTALFIGDYLFALVLNEVAKIKNGRVHTYLSETLKQICNGEIIQYEDLYNIDTRELDYLKKIKRKTAILIACSCALGSISSGAIDEYVEKSYKFGYYLGMSYQIMDDYLDFVADEKVLGKDTGQDLMSGNITLPIIFKIKKDRKKFLGYKNFTEIEKLNLISELKADKEILSKVKLISDRYLTKAKLMLEKFPKNVREDLLFIVASLANRNY